jgi:hypothetical protein
MDLGLNPRFAQCALSEYVKPNLRWRYGFKKKKKEEKRLQDMDSENGAVLGIDFAIW